MPKARYALEELLRPLGLCPAWVRADELGGDGMYVGLHPEKAGSALALRLHTETLDYFASPRSYDPADATWTDLDGERVPVLFPTRATPEEADLVASAFFWLSGWQEVTTRARDEHGRFPYAASLQAALDCTAIPSVDGYRRMLARRLEAHGVPVQWTTWQGKPWAVALSHDIDLLRKRRLGTAFRAVRRGDGKRRAALRQAALAPDPRRLSIDRMAAAERAHGAGATYFFKTAARGPWDVPYASNSRYLRDRIAALEADGFEIGLHPSYFGHDHLRHLEEERDRLKALTAAPPATVRQHFLRYDPVATPRLHAAAGFRLDSTLGFAEREGFRRGTCHPFRLFDIPLNAPLGVWELPLVVMDTTLFTHRALGPSAAEHAVGTMYEACRRARGCCVALWHNTIYDEVDFPGQAAVFERMLGAAVEQGAAVLSLRDALATQRE